MTCQKRLSSPTTSSFSAKGESYSRELWRSYGSARQSRLSTSSSRLSAGPHCREREDPDEGPPPLPSTVCVFAISRGAADSAHRVEEVHRVCHPRRNGGGA